MRQAALLFFLALTLAILGGRWLWSAAIAANEPSPPQLNASRAAADLAPWDAARRVDLAWALQAHHDTAAAREMMRSASILAPADAWVWRNDVALLVEQGRFDRTLTLATERVNALAPTDADTQAQVAEAGLRYWVRGSAELQQQWLASMRYQQRHDPQGFYRAFHAAGDTVLLCLALAGTLQLQPVCGTGADT